ncbi:hypothetical protein PIB30_005857 [Stylosanthes scabra]|uniref:FAR1 domain-containing protein n=1 Tax=Stylosanthes scabra TaxID=79078 RepID=A0ABU6Z3W1_9FABA|nr:hypothetical protein [Stylosanthes scabra]
MESVVGWAHHYGMEEAQLSQTDSASKDEGLWSYAGTEAATVSVEDQNTLDRREIEREGATAAGPVEEGSPQMERGGLLEGVFEGVEDAYNRYVAYARTTGFAVRKGNSVKDESGNIVRKFFYCNRQGLREKKHYERPDRKRAHKAEIRTNCYAK